MFFCEKNIFCLFSNIRIVWWRNNNHCGGKWRGLDVASNSDLLRGAPAKFSPITINSGQHREITVGSMKYSFATKYVVKFKVDSEDKESVLFQEYYNHGAGAIVLNSTAYYTNELQSFYKVVTEDESTSGSGTRTFRLWNFSAKPITVYFGVSSALHKADIPCVDYSDIDFEF